MEQSIDCSIFHYTEVPMSRFNEIAQIYDHRLPQLRSPEVWEQTLRMTSSFWRLNFCEAMLLTLQNPKAEMCGTIDQ